MTFWTDPAVRDALDLPDVGGEMEYSGVFTDTRTMPPGALFVALSGDRFDGHNFLAEAAAAGATGAVVRAGTPAPAGLVIYEVPDTLRAFGNLARERRRALTGPVVAVTGTNGKTSTKEMVAAALRTRYYIHATRINLNNLVGVPLTILEAASATEGLVVEAGANQPGEIRRHREVIEPTIVVITNVSAGHLEGFGSGQGVLQEKLVLVEGAPLAIVGTDPPTLAEEARGRARRVISAGLWDADQIPDALELLPDGRPRVTVGRHSFTLPACGRHQAANAMFAWTAATVLQLDLEAVAAALEGVELPGGRGEVKRIGGLTVLDDSYNANPASFRAAIDLAGAMRAGGRRRLAFVAGTMRELGEASAALHEEIAAALVALGPDLLAAVGDFVPALEPWRRELGERLLTAPDAPALSPLLAERLRGDELLVLKGSRGVALERLLPDLAARFPSSSP